MKLIQCQQQIHAAVVVPAAEEDKSYGYTLKNILELYLEIPCSDNVVEHTTNILL